MTIKEYARDAVSKYLHSVVLVDDRLFEEQQSSRTEDVSDVNGMPDLGSVRTEVNPEGSSAADVSAATPPVRTNSIDVLSITNGFASKGIVCGGYRPSFFPENGFENNANFKTLLSICKRADVFILDWRLFDHNRKAVECLLKKISEEDGNVTSPRPVRFCAIYTAEDLSTVRNHVIHALCVRNSSERTGGVEPICVGGLTVCFYGKEAVTSSDAYVAATDLAERIINDFAEKHKGILSALTLRGIASIRENTKRILDRFPISVDSELILHAGLTIGGKSVSDDISTLLCDEVAAILHDEKESDDTIYDLCGDYVKGCASSIFDVQGDGVIRQGVDSDAIKDFCRRVFEQRTFFPRNDNNESASIFTKCKESNKKFSPKWKCAELLGRFAQKSVVRNEERRFGELAALFCQRTNYAERKMLRFGTVVKKDDGDYYVCLMPLCDSIRLKDRDENSNDVRHRFPFWQLTKVAENFHGQSHGLVLKEENGEYCPYCAKGKIRDSFSLFEFTSQDSIVLFDENGSVRTADRNSSFKWVAELKSAHIQRMAEFVSREFSRVGLTESEWLRLQVNR